VITVLNVFVELFLIHLQYHLMFLLTKHRVCCRFFFNKQPAFLRFFVRRCTVHSMPRSHLRNFATLSIRYLPCILLHIKKIPCITLHFILHKKNNLLPSKSLCVARYLTFPNQKQHLLHMQCTEHPKPEEMTQYERNDCDKPRGLGLTM